MNIVTRKITTWIILERLLISNNRKRLVFCANLYPKRSPNESKFVEIVQSDEQEEERRR
jgi:hypothetical protein